VNTPPNEHRYIFHRRILGAAKGFLTGGVTGAIGGAFTGDDRPSRRRGGSPVAQTTVGGRGLRPSDKGGFRPGGRARRAQEQERKARRAARGSVGSCGPGKRRGRGGACVETGFLPAAGRFFLGPPREASTDMTTTGPRSGREQSMGAYSPMVELREHRECFPGDVLGRDGFCYNKSAITNKNRAWPKGRRALGTPGEMAALAKAASFGRRMEGTVKRMQKIGVLKKPSRRAVARRVVTHGVPKQIAPTSIVHTE